MSVDSSDDDDDNGGMDRKRFSIFDATFAKKDGTSKIKWMLIPLAAGKSRLIPRYQFGNERDNLVFIKREGNHKKAFKGFPESETCGEHHDASARRAAGKIFVKENDTNYFMVPIQFPNGEFYVPRYRYGSELDQMLFQQVFPEGDETGPVYICFYEK